MPEFSRGDRVKIIRDEIFPSNVGKRGVVVSSEPCIAPDSCWIYVLFDKEEPLFPRTVWRGPYSASYLVIEGHSRKLLHDVTGDTGETVKERG